MVDTFETRRADRQAARHLGRGQRAADETVAVVDAEPDDALLTADVLAGRSNPVTVDLTRDDAPAAEPDTDDRSVVDLAAVGTSDSRNDVTPPLPPAQRLALSLTTATFSLGSAIGEVPVVLLRLPMSATPLSDVVDMLENVLQSVGDSAVALAQVPGDIVDLLRQLTGPGLSTVTGKRVGVGPAAGAGMMTLPAMREFGLPFLASADPAALGSAQLLRLFSPLDLLAFTVTEQTAAVTAAPADGRAQSLMDRTFNALIVPISLWALATGALPGVAGLLIILVAGVRLGYRQAKANFVLRSTGLARFAGGSGPLGVVREGMVVALHRRSTVVLPGADVSRWADQIA